MADENTTGNNPSTNGAAEPAVTGGFLSIQDAVDLHVAQSQPPAEPAPQTEAPPVTPNEASEPGSSDTEGTPSPVEPPDLGIGSGEPQVETFPKPAPEVPPAEPAAAPPAEGLPEVETGESPGEEPSIPPAANIAFMHDGKQITVDEAQKGYQRFSDYTRKTQEVAEQRTAVEADTLALTTERQQYAQNLNYMTKQLEALKGLDGSVNWEQLEEDDPIGYLQAKDRQRSVDEHMTQIGKEQERLAAIEQTQTQAAQERHIQTEQTALMEAMPAWSNPEIASSDRAKISQYLNLKGISTQEMAGIYDHRLIAIFADAVIGHALKDKKPLAAKKVVKAKPGMQSSGAPAPGTNQSARVTAANKRFTQSASLEDAVDLQMEMHRG